MQTLAAIQSELGRVTLVEDEGLFFTTRTYADARDGALRVSTIHESREEAQRFYDNACKRGAVYGAWPEAGDG